MNKMDQILSELCEENDCLKYELEQARIEANNWRELYNRTLNNTIDNNDDLVKKMLKKTIMSDDEKECLHDKCPICYGTGKKPDGIPCIHMLSCPCPKCSPRY